jgi:prophage regulatory protein
VRFVRTKDVTRMIGVSRTTLWRMVRAGTFPRPVRIAIRATGHVLEEVEAWMAERAGPPPGEPDVAQLLAARADDRVHPHITTLNAAQSARVDGVGPIPMRRRRRGRGWSP